ncbi:Proto-oncogene tyrosine-protein kinase receptor Ret [Geodia barretti]|uniref:Proto-oncogene tyrosine-protein kinase receptor Ret n=1 Tax=Geodia barretti TaxID=519541 RepID=A0AA35TWB0_GEOBA|nr:Proto-oncogene tyrosine-protein kinase receptor Ret [Geodia barretti]
MAGRLARSLLQRRFGSSLQRLPVRLASGEAYVPEKPPVEGKTENMKLVHAINNALDIAMETDSTAAIFGEDVGFGGVFRCSANLRDKYGSNRVFTCTIQVTIGAGGRIKVSDFGMAVERGSEGYYRVASGKTEKVPVKWMAPESIEDHIYTHKTDVWSFGVTCWEVFTCGAVPYPGLNPLNVPRELKLGRRLERPSSAVCSDEM